MQNTPNYGLKKPTQSDFYNVDDFNANADIIDTEMKNLDTELASVGTDITNINSEIGNLETNKLDKTGDASNVTNTFTQASTRANLVSGENQSTTFGKLMKWFADLKPVAWSGNASDLTEDASNRLVTDSEKTTWNGKASTAPVTTTANGLMISTDKSKLDGVATGANNYTHPSTHPPSIIVQDAGNRFVTDAEKTAWNGKLDKSGGTMTGDIVLVGDPTQPLHPVTKQYIETLKVSDSEKLDGLDSASFLRSDINDTKYGIATFNNSVITNADFKAAANVEGFAFIVTSDGYYSFRADVTNAGYYLKKNGQDNTSMVYRYSTLRLGDVAIHKSDININGENHIYRQVPTIDFDVESHNNEEGEECIFLLDILESMQNKINTLENEVAILKGQ